MRDLPFSQFFDQCQKFLQVPTDFVRKACLSTFRFVKRPTHSERVTSVVVLIWTSFWRSDFLLESSEMLWKRWSQSIRNWSYTPLCTVFTGLWFAVTLRWVSKQFLWAQGIGTFEGASDIIDSSIVRGRLIHLLCWEWAKRFFFAEAGSFLRTKYYFIPCN